tara:strand:+ start:115 stop:375 length:261 start_codon:yes stop_codon:yes gene_type:complete
MKATIAVTLEDVEDPREFIRQLLPPLEEVVLTGTANPDPQGRSVWVYVGTLRKDGTDIGCIEITLGPRANALHSEAFFEGLDYEEL